MIILYTLIGILFYICLVCIIGNTNLNDKIKERIFKVTSVIYNGFLGYIDTYFALLLYGYFTNLPKGTGYEVPESEAGFNFMIGIIILLVYLALLIPFNIYMNKKGKISVKVYMIINVIATLLGIIIFWAFLDKSKRFF